LKWTFAIGAACLSALVASPRLARSADHLDAPATKADPTADINDLYSWVDGSNVVMAMTVYPAAPAGAKFSDKVQYVFHTSSGAGFGATTSDVNVICTFDAAQKIQCWAGDEYVTGDASQAAGVASKSGKLKVFAGLRADPFFFNLAGFKDTVAAVEGAAASLTFNTAGCPNLDTNTATALRGMLQGTSNGTAAAQDFFKTLNTLAIVVSVDKSLVTKGGATMSVWASTNKGQ
jgi:hypothetical protein